MSSISGLSGINGKVSITGLSGGSSGSSSSSSTFINIIVTSLATIANAVITILTVTNLIADQITVTTLIVEGSVVQDGNLVVNGTLDVHGNDTFGTALVPVISTFYGDVNISENITAASATLSNELEVNILTVLGDLSVAGESGFTGLISAFGGATLTGVLQVTGFFNISGPITSNVLTLNGTSSVIITAGGQLTLTAGNTNFTTSNFNIESTTINMVSGGVLTLIGGASAEINADLVNILGEVINIGDIVGESEVFINQVLYVPVEAAIGVDSSPGVGLLNLKNAEGIRTSSTNIVTPTQVGYLSDLPGHLGAFFARLSVNNTFTAHNYQTISNDLSNDQAVLSLNDTLNLIYAGNGSNVRLSARAFTGIYDSNANWDTSNFMVGDKAGTLVNSTTSNCNYIGVQAGQRLAGSGNNLFGTLCMSITDASVEGFSCYGNNIQSTSGNFNCSAFGNNAVITKNNTVVLGGVSATVVVPNAIEIDTPALACTVVGVSGTGECYMPFRGTAYKKVLIYIDNLEGVCTVDFPVPFTKEPILACFNNSVAPSDITLLNETTIEITIAGTTKTGIYSLEGF